VKLPRNLSGEALCGLLEQFGYVVVRQTGSHIRMTTTLHGKEHHITIPRHSPLKTGTLSSILSDVAAHLEITKAELVDKLFQ